MIFLCSSVLTEDFKGKNRSRRCCGKRCAKASAVIQGDDLVTLLQNRTSDSTLFSADYEQNGISDFGIVNGHCLF